MIPVHSETPGQSNLFLEEQVIRLQALLEAARQVHSTIDLHRVLEHAARIIVLELEMEGALFTHPLVSFGNVPAALETRTCTGCVRLPLHARDGSVLADLLVFTPGDRTLSLVELDFLEGLVLQTAIAAENAANHQRHLEYARIAQDLDAARAIQQSLLPQTMPDIPGYSIAARSSACYQVGGDYLDIVAQPDGSHLLVIADVAGKGLASALVCTSFRSAFRALARERLPLDAMAARLSQQHWDEGAEARRRYVTAVFLRLHAAFGTVEVVNAGHNPVCLLASGSSEPHMVDASGTPLGMLPGITYQTEHLQLDPGASLLLYTDGLTEVFCDEEEFGLDRLIDVFRRATSEQPAADHTLTTVWAELDQFTNGAPQCDDMSAIALIRLYPAPQETT